VVLQTSSVKCEKGMNPMILVSYYWQNREINENQIKKEEGQEITLSSSKL
jgi:hypothetical protein